MLENIPVGSCVDGRYYKLAPVPEEPKYLFDYRGDAYSWRSLLTPEFDALKAYKWQKPPAAALTYGLHYINQPTNRGTDPEFFLWDGKERIPAFGVLPSKQERTGSWFWDGFQAETVVDADSCHETIAKNISTRMTEASYLKLKIHPSTVWRVPDLLLNTASDAHVALGCDPSKNAYGMKGRQVLYPKLLKWRFAGGHIHFQMNDLEKADLGHVLHIVRCLDAYLGVPSVALFQNVDHWIRRRYYGLAGEFRLPKHGLEYRTLSNAWAWHPLSFMLTFDLARQAFSMGRAHYRSLFKGDQRRVVEIINNCDVKAAKAMTYANREFYDMWADWRYGSSTAFWSAIDKGIDKVIPNFGQDIINSWLGIETYEDAPHWANL